MSATVLRHPSASPAATWPGDTAVDRAGATLARDMFLELEGPGMDAQGIGVADYSSLENWPREGHPFRNIVAEYAVKAHAAGPEVLEAFYAVLSDFIALTCSGSVPDGSLYDRFCD